MSDETTVLPFESDGRLIRRQWVNDRWYFSVVDVVAVLTDSVDSGAYWRKLKQRLLETEGASETVTNCHVLKMRALDGKLRATDAADTETLLRIIQSIPSPKAEPFKRWLAKVGAERIEEVDQSDLMAGFSDEQKRLFLRGQVADWNTQLTEEGFRPLQAPGYIPRGKALGGSSHEFRPLPVSYRSGRIDTYGRTDGAQDVQVQTQAHA